VGVEQIDREHQWWFALVEGLHQAMLAGTGRQALRSLLADRASYTCYHFSHEERLMEHIGYPGPGEHGRQHEDLKAKVPALQTRMASGEMTMTIEATQFLIDGSSNIRRPAIGGSAST
jgi:hemerythrin-like metal-binding protein